MTLPANQYPATFVTGANEPYVRCLHLMLRSAARHRLVEGIRWIVYDLGMSQASRDALANCYPWIEIRGFDFSAWPAHAALARRSYAWKPIVIHEVVEAADGVVVWFDSATVFKAGMDYLIDTVRRDGAYVPRGRAAMSERCEPATLEKLAFPRPLYDSRERCAAVIGIDAGNPVARRLTREWFELSLDEQTIQPARRAIERHMHEQALLSCVFLAAEYRGAIRMAPDDIDISSPCPVPFLSSRNKVPGWVPLWADAAVRAWFATDKRLDQSWLRIREADMLFDPLLTWLYGRFSVRLSPDGGATETAVEAPAGHYYADPFLVEREGGLWLFVEDYSYLARRGTVAALPVDAKLSAGPAVKVLDPGAHVSFPFLLAFGERLFMVPETGKAGGVDLYECERFPDRWTKRRRLLDAPGAADPCIFRHGERWWLAVSLQSPNPAHGARYLALFHTDDLLAGHWTPHPVNEQALYLGTPHGTGRNAGAIVDSDGRLFRPMQQSRNFYAEGMTMMEIVELSPAAYREVPAPKPFPFENIVDRPCVHHVSQAGRITAWDVRTRHR